MTTLRATDRQLLGDAGLELDDRAYVEALAGLGVDPGRAPDPSGGGKFVIWFAGPLVTAEQDRPRWSRQELLGFVEGWQALRRKVGSPRVSVDDRWRAHPALPSVCRVLARPEAGTSSVFVETRMPRADLRVQMPLRIGAWPEDFADLALHEVAAQWPASSMMEFHQISRDHARCDVLVIRGTVRAALQRILASPFSVRAAFVLLLSPADVAWSRAHDLATSLLSDTQAAGLSLVELEPPVQFAALFDRLANEISHNTPFDVALHRAFGESGAPHLLDTRLIEAMALPSTARVLGRRLRALPKMAALRLPAGTAGRIRSGWTTAAPPEALGTELLANADALPFEHEGEGSTALSEIGVAERAARAEATASETARVLQSDLFAIRDGEAVKETRPFVVGRPYRLEVFIGAPGLGDLEADKEFPDKLLDWQNADQFTLGVIFSEPNQWATPQIGELILGRYGTSTRCRFDFTPTKVDPFRGRITIQYRGRVLQTALLESLVAASAAAAAEADVLPRLAVEMELRRSLATLDDRRRFDVSLVLNRTVDDKPTLQAAGPHGAYIASLDDVTLHLATISSHLTEVAHDAKRYSKGLTSAPCTEMLVKLASEGSGLYASLVTDYIDGSAAAEALRVGEYLQIVATKPDAVVPLELAYAYAAPADDAKVCPNARQALLAGQCPAECVPTSAPAQHVCPMGFWGLQKVIERHVHNPGLGIPAFVSAVEPSKDRDVVKLTGPALMAMSNNVPPGARKRLKAAIEKQWKAGKLSVVQKWSQWPTVIGSEKPVLVVALPHSDGAGVDISLEIGGDTLKSKFIDGKYLRAQPTLDPPMVLLMGCDVAGAGDTNAYTRHIAQFRRHGAPVILGTLATIDGADAATAAALVVRQLVATVSSKPARFGEVLRNAKREAMADGLLMTLGLVGFGDADWQLRF